MNTGSAGKKSGVAKIFRALGWRTLSLFACSMIIAGACAFYGGASPFVRCMLIICAIGFICAQLVDVIISSAIAPIMRARAARRQSTLDGCVDCVEPFLDRARAVVAIATMVVDPPNDGAARAYDVTALYNCLIDQQLFSNLRMRLALESDAIIRAVYDCGASAIIDTRRDTAIIHFPGAGVITSAM